MLAACQLGSRLQYPKLAYDAHHGMSAGEEADEEGGKPSSSRKRGSAAAKAAADSSGRKRPRRGQMEIEYEEEREDTRQTRRER